MNILEIKNLTKTINQKKILNDLTLNIPNANIIAIVGPSGSGKSTLLRCINRLIEIDKGNIYLSGTNIKEIPPIELRRNIGYVHQESIMLPGTVYDNIAYGPSLLGEIDTNQIHQSAQYAGLSLSLFTQQADTLSGGEKKRVALARTLALNPQILLLDEPTSGVDPKRVTTVEKNIISFSERLGLTVLWVTHDVEQAKRVSTSIANLKNGTIPTLVKTTKFKWGEAY